ncbi:MAG: type II toxin-antitoxin system HicA family toxin [Proteobacteria bacterium]|nr:type II toxin-antitoxin system HicA family toxin [Pseudomonadota bacterium]
MVEKEGWTLVRAKGSHQIFEHSEKQGVIVIPNHKGTLPVGTANSILKQAGVCDD